MTTEGHGVKVDRLREQAIAALLMHPTVEAAATAAGVTKRTLTRWQREAEFAAAYREARREVVQQATTKLSASCVRAVETLDKIMDMETAPATSRIMAARTVLEYAHRGLELDDLAVRVDALEAARE